MVLSQLLLNGTDMIWKPVPVISGFRKDFFVTCLDILVADGIECCSLSDYPLMLDMMLLGYRLGCC